MKRTKDRLSTKRVEALVKKAASGRHADGGGLYLSISPQGHARWTFMYKRGAKQTEIGIHNIRSRQGLAPLADARAAAARFRDMLTQGIDPKVGKRPVVTMTFGDCADAAMKTRKWRHPKTSKQWRHQLTMHCASIQDVPVAEITKDHVVSVLEPLWTTKQVTAVTLRSRIEFVLGWATANKHRSGDNPARWKNNLQFFLPQPKAPVQHFAAMDYRNIPEFVARLQKHEGVPALALEFLIHTGCRLNEVLGARWNEIDLNTNDGPVWEIPAPRMKMEKPHRVPLSQRCVEIIQKLRANHDVLKDVRTNDYIFFGATFKNQPISRHSMCDLMRNMGVKETRHGMRSAFRIWCAEVATLYPAEVCETALAHSLGSKVTRSYLRTDLFALRRELMADWSAFAAGANLVQLKTKSRRKTA